MSASKKKPTTSIVFENYSLKKQNDIATTSFYHLVNEDVKFLHYHNAMEIGKCISGSGFCYINDLIIPFKENDVQIILPFQPHYNIPAKNSSNTLWYFTSFEPLKISTKCLHLDINYIVNLLNTITISGIFSVDTYPVLSNLVNSIIEESISNNKFKHDIIAAKIYILLMELSQIGSSNNVKTNQLTIDNTQIDMILPSISAVSIAISKGYPLSVKEMADSCNLSESYFRKIFTAIIGESPKKYLDKCYLDQAVRLLFETDKSITSIMSEIGIEEPSTFYRKFTKMYGFSPSEYRKQNIKPIKQ